VTARRPPLVAILCVLATLAAAVSCGGGDGAPDAGAPGPGDAEPQADGSDAGEPDSALEPLPRDEVEVFYPSAAGDGLAGERHEIFSTATPGDRVKQIVADLIGGPANPGHARALPAGTRLRQAWVLEDESVAFLDFSSELAEGVGGGSTNELLTVYSIVNSVVANVDEVERVAILINGRTVESLNGHLDLRRPLAADWSLVVGGSATAEGTPAATPAAPRPAPALARGTLAGAGRPG